MQQGILQLQFVESDNIRIPIHIEPNRKPDSKCPQKQHLDNKLQWDDSPMEFHSQTKQLEIWPRGIEGCLLKRQPKLLANQEYIRLLHFCRKTRAKLITTPSHQKQGV